MEIETGVRFDYYTTKVGDVVRLKNVAAFHELPANKRETVFLMVTIGNRFGLSGKKLLAQKYAECLYPPYLPSYEHFDGRIADRDDRRAEVQELYDMFIEIIDCDLAQPDHE
ncbi:hypothetical protein LB465_00140 [Salegentibacter sp. LM13S]|uniref:hypothetical protein n=1 Tax=Salegentibacter lacus TaxID=2873599 RepID=UPI001CCCB30D|nr:hypothetical protein [Salegentibacter lacus]MBZ9629167.1 hypothetical protein [Salegentibacter lacus]